LPKKYVMENWYQNLRKTYPKLSEDILSEYRPADEYVVINIDQDLHPVYIKLPEPPPLHTITNWGLPASKQYFVREKMPQKLTALVSQCETVEEIWEALEQNQGEYYSEIGWIQNMWHHRLYGKWYWINGKPVYLDGWHFMYCNFWKFNDGKIPDYRERNWKYFHSMRYAYTTTEKPETDKDGRLVYEDRQSRRLKMVETGNRTFNGVAYPKHRRDGATNMCGCAMYCETTTREGVNSGIVSMTGEHAKNKIFNEIVVPGWQQMPFFFKPIYSGNEKPEKELAFFASRKKAGARLREQLRSRIDYSETSKSTFYDGGKNLWLLVDESGKTTEDNVYSRHQQLKNCVAQGNGANIIGFISCPSTVGEMMGQGGKNYFDLCQDSRYERRDISGQTKTGMLLIYLPATEGLEGFIDEYGSSVVEKPTARQAKYINKPYGSKEYLDSKREQLLADGDILKYNEEVRLFPTRYMECFRTEDGEIGFNTKIINDRLDELAFIGKKMVRRGNFKWENNEPDTKVIWEDHDNGRFYMSQMLKPEAANRFYWDGEHRHPINPKYTACGDTFKFNKVQHRRMSNGGGAVFWHYDQEVDGKTTIEHWQSNRFVCTYNYRPETVDEYCEDMLMMCVYFGSWMYPEINVPKLWEYFEARGYAGYLKYDVDIKTGKQKVTPGFNSEGGSKQDLFNGLRDYLQRHGKRERHGDLLNECKEIKSIEEMTDYDLLTAAGGALLGAKAYLVTVKKPEAPKQDITDYFETFSYKRMRN
jgi:hypothetical protein